MSDNTTSIPNGTVKNELNVSRTDEGATKAIRKYFAVRDENGKYVRDANGKIVSNPIVVDAAFAMFEDRELSKENVTTNTSNSSGSSDTTSSGTTGAVGSCAIVDSAEIGSISSVVLTNFPGKLLKTEDPEKGKGKDDGKEQNREDSGAEK